MPSLRNVVHHSRESREEELAVEARIADRLANLFSDRLDEGLPSDGALPTGMDAAGVAAVGRSPDIEPSTLRPRRRRAMRHADLLELEPVGDHGELVGVMVEPSEVSPEWVLPDVDARPGDVDETRAVSLDAPARRALSRARFRRSLARKADVVLVSADVASDLVELVGVIAQPCDDAATPEPAPVGAGLVSAEVTSGSAAPEAEPESEPEVPAPRADQLGSPALHGATSPGMVEPAGTPPIETGPLEPAQAPVTEPSIYPVGRSRRAAERAGSAPSVRRRSTVGPKVTRKVVAIVATAACPHCGLLLQPPPVSSRRCARCQQRIVVKHIEGRTVYLTEAALVVFEAERRRQASSGRFTRERARWLKLAEAAAARPDRIARLAAALPSEDGVTAARTLYMGAVDRAFRAAKRNHQWETASRIRRKQAADLYRIAGSPMPPPADLMALFREGVTAELRGIAEVSRNAELVSASCCDVCRADDRRILRISVELREPRLPHEGCPRGFCRCGWALAERDRAAIRQYIRRGPRTEPRALHEADSGPR